MTTIVKRFIIVQPGKLSTNYLCGWCASGGPEGSGWFKAESAEHDVPVWLQERDQALTFDWYTASQLVDRFDTRYHRLIRHCVEEQKT